MRRAAAGALRRAAGRVGVEIVRVDDAKPDKADRSYPPDFGADDIALCQAVRDWTMTSAERILALRDAVRYAVAAGVPGDVVECGVWRGGSMQVVARELRALGTTDRDLWLYDTFESMPPPTERDVDVWGRRALDDWNRWAEQGDSVVDPAFYYRPFEVVRDKLYETGYPQERFHFVRGLVEETLPDQAPDQIAVLRLDTDFYESTRHELHTLMPRVSPLGVVIIDDYGHFRGAREAVDEYLSEQGLTVLLNRIDYSGRLFVVPSVPPP